MFKRIAMLFAPTLAMMLLVVACTKPEPIHTPPQVVFLEPPEHPVFVEQCRAQFHQMTNLPTVSRPADYYCGCVAELTLHVTDNYARQPNVSESNTLVSTCMDDTKIVYPPTSIN